MKIKEGGGMNVQKEREAFEDWYIRNMDTNGDFEKISEQDSPYMDEHVNNSWLTWQAAKAQAVPDGYQLVKKELNAELMYAVAGTDDINEHLWIEQIYKGLLKAQEPSQ